MRVDFNVPLRDGQVENDKRIRESLRTIRYLMDHRARTVLMSHLGRPKGKVSPEFSLAPVAARLTELLEIPVGFVSACIGEEVQSRIKALQAGEVLLLENLRFHAEEEANDPNFAAELARGIEIYVNDAFGTAHRAHASTEGITHHVKQAAAGFLMQKELNFLGAAIAEPKRPFVGIIGGAKVSGKIDMIENMLPRVDKLLIGGGMTYTFMKAQGYEIGKSLLEEDKVDLAYDILWVGGQKIELPMDFLVSDHFDFKERTVGSLHTVIFDHIPPDAMALDIGPNTVERYWDTLMDAGTIVWNGPMGVFEIESLAGGTFAIAQALADATAKGATTIIGGGDSAAAIEQANLADRVSHVSTGGGASLEFLEGKALPGVLALTDRA